LNQNLEMTVIEKELIESIKKGNSKSFELVFKTYYRRLCTFAFNYTQQLEMAEDIVKDFFEAFWINKEKLEIKTSLSGYLFCSVRNSCINYLERDKRRKKTVSIEDLSRMEIKCSEPYSNDYFLGDIFERELEQKISVAIEKLPAGCREIFKLSRIEGLSHKKISEKLKISENTVKVQIYNALKYLKEAILPGTIILFQLFL
jgi:RNA polymerase sigma-70 factor (ECF subfamily)